MDYRITPEVLTFFAGQFGFDGVVRCAVVEILDDAVICPSYIFTLVAV